MRWALERVTSARGIDYEVGGNCDRIEEMILDSAWQTLCYEVYSGDSCLRLFGVTEAEWLPVERGGMRLEREVDGLRETIRILRSQNDKLRVENSAHLTSIRKLVKALGKEV